MLFRSLRRFLDDQVWFENRRVIDLLRDIEARALQLRDSAMTVGLSMEIDAAAAEIRLPMERPLYTPISKPRLDSESIRPAGDSDETDPAALFDQVYVDPGPLRAAVRSALRRAPQVGLADLIVAAPLTLGAAELVTYLTLRDDAFTIVYDEARTEQIGWNDSGGNRRTATLPRVTFTRSTRSAA